jgi:glutathione S-transferase
VQLNRECTDYCRAIQKWPAMAEWTAAAQSEPSELEELDVEF